MSTCELAVMFSESLTLRLWKKYGPPVRVRGPLTIRSPLLYVTCDGSGDGSELAGVYPVVGHVTIGGIVIAADPVVMPPVIVTPDTDGDVPAWMMLPLTVSALLTVTLPLARSVAPLSAVAALYAPLLE